MQYPYTGPPCWVQTASSHCHRHRKAGGWEKHDGGGDVCLGGANKTSGWKKLEGGFSFLKLFEEIEVAIFSNKHLHSRPHGQRICSLWKDKTRTPRNLETGLRHTLQGDYKMFHCSTPGQVWKSPPQLSFILDHFQRLLNTHTELPQT